MKGALGSERHRILGAARLGSYRAPPPRAFQSRRRTHSTSYLYLIIIDALDHIIIYPAGHTHARNYALCNSKSMPTRALSGIHEVILRNPEGGLT